MHKGIQLAVAALAAAGMSASAAQAVPIWAIDDAPGQRLITFDSATPATLTSSIGISGLQPNEKLIGIDFRISASGLNQNVLYGVGSLSRIYTINPSTAAATFIGTLTDQTTGLPILLNGTEFGFDFNPQADRLRIVSDLDQNLRINVDLPVANTIQDTPLNPSSSNVTNVAYDRNDQSAGTPTTLFGIDTFSNELVRIGGPDGTPSPNGGTVTAVGSLIAFDPTGMGGFDIAPGSGVAYMAAANAAGGGAMLSTLNLTTGVASVVGFIGNPEDGLMIKGIAIPIPEPTSVALLGIGALSLLSLLSRRRSR